MLGFIAELNALEHPDDFRAEVLPGLRALVPCDIATYNELQLEDGRMVAMQAAEDPPGAIIPEAPEIFVRFGHQNPLVALYQRTRDGRPYKWSDFITRRELHATELYRQAYEPMGVEYQMAFALPAPIQLIIAYALNRGTRDFSERDRRLLNLIRAPLIQTYRTVQRYAALSEQLTALERGLEQSRTGVAVIERGASGAGIGFASAEAARALGIDGTSGAPRAALRAWLAQIPAGRGAEPVAPLLLSTDDGSSTVVHYLPARRRGDPETLLIQRSGDALSTEAMRGAGLTQREAEVLQLVALGHTNAEIANRLAVSPRTVQKHLEHVYEKLGATSRTQAVLTAWSITPGAA